MKKAEVKLKHIKKNYFNKTVLLFLILPLYLVAFKPIVFPFVDDWIVIKWNSGDENLFELHSIQVVNGHQIFLSKALFILLSFISAYNIQLISFSSIILGYTGIILLIKSQIRYVGNSTNKYFVFSIIVISMTYKQLQNFFMPICNQWMIAVFFIGMYYWLKQQNNSTGKILATCLIILAAPISTGLGLILPIVEVIENVYRFKTKQSDYVKSNKHVLCTAISFISIIFFLFVPHLNMGDASGVNSNTNYLTSATNLFHLPYKSVLFTLSLIGNIFVPASRFEPALPIISGALFMLITCVLLWLGRKKIRIDDIFLNKSCVLGGIAFLGIMYLSRFSEDNHAITAVAAPRYVTGSMIFVIGLLGIIQKINSKNLFKIILLICSLFAFSSGLKTGLEWHSTRYGQASYFVKCMNSKEADYFQPGAKCYTLLLRESYAPNISEYNKQLESFLISNKG
jgi:hypothetical protein